MLGYSASFVNFPGSLNGGVFPFQALNKPGVVDTDNDDHLCIVVPSRGMFSVSLLPFAPGS